MKPILICVVMSVSFSTVCWKKGIVVSKLIFRWNHNRPHIVEVMLDCTFSPIWIWILCTFEERGQWKDGWLVATHSYNMFNKVYCTSDNERQCYDNRLETITKVSPFLDCLLNMYHCSLSFLSFSLCSYVHLNLGVFVHCG